MHAFTIELTGDHLKNVVCSTFNSLISISVFCAIQRRFGGFMFCIFKLIFSMNVDLRVHCVLFALFEIFVSRFGDVETPN